MLGRISIQSWSNVEVDLIIIVVHIRLTIEQDRK